MNKITEEEKNKILIILKALNEISSTIGSLEINKYKMINNENIDSSKLGELELTKNTLILDFISAKDNLNNLIKKSLLNSGIKENELEKCSLNLQSGEVSTYRESK